MISIFNKRGAESGEYLFGYGGESLESPEAFVFVPEGMTASIFMDLVNLREMDEFMQSIQNSSNFSQEGNLIRTHILLERARKFGEKYGLCGLEMHNRYVMSNALSAYVQSHRDASLEDKIPQYMIKKYGLVERKKILGLF
jgi:hypothetical protein